jgi:hypothetical protein
MKVASSLALITVFAAAASAFGLNGGKSVVSKTHKGLAFSKTPLVQAVDVQGNAINHGGVVRQS